MSQRLLTPVLRRYDPAPVTVDGMFDFMSNVPILGDLFTGIESGLTGQGNANGFFGGLGALGGKLGGVFLTKELSELIYGKNSGAANPYLTYPLPSAAPASTPAKDYAPLLIGGGLALLAIVLLTRK